MRIFNKLAAMSQSTMKALQLTRSSATSPPVLSLTTLPAPIAKPGYAVVKIHYSSIQPADKLNAKGLFPKTSFPRIPGRDYSGVVVDIADGSVDSEKKRRWIGKKVYGTGGSTLGFEIDGPHAQFCLVPEDALVEKPAPLSFLQAATVGVPFVTALLCLRRAKASKDDVVLVIGANGAAGSSAVQVAKAMGCKRVLTASRRAEDCPDVNLALGDPDAVFQAAIPALTDGRGVDVVVDTVGDLAIMAAAVEQLALRGRYSWIAAPRGGASTQFSFDIFQAYRKEIEFVGCNSGNWVVTDAAQDLRVLKEWFDNGALRSRDDEVFETVGIDNAIEKGYMKGPGGKQVVIAMV
jgi:NADPH2:quinone reductase